MMDCGKKTLILLTLCALAGAQRLHRVQNHLEALVSIPSSHIGDTEIESAVLTLTAAHPFMYTVVAQKNKTQCFDSPNPLCLSLIKEPRVDVSVSSRASNGKTFSYSDSINGSLRLTIFVDSEVSVTPEIMAAENDTITVILDIMYDTTNTSRGSFRSQTRPNFSLNAQFSTIVGMAEDNGQGNGQGNGQENGQPSLGCGPLSALILVALLPVFLLK